MKSEIGEGRKEIGSEKKGMSRQRGVQSKTQEVGGEKLGEGT